MGIHWVLSAVLELSPGQFPFPFSTGFTHFKPPLLYSQLMVLCMLHRNHLPSLQTHLAPLLDTSLSPCQFTHTPVSHSSLLLCSSSVTSYAQGPPALKVILSPLVNLRLSCEVTLSPSFIAALALGSPCLLQSTALDCLDLNLDFGILDPNLPYLLRLTAACHHDSLRSSQIRLVSSFATLATNYHFSPCGVTSAS